MKVQYKGDKTVCFNSLPVGTCFLFPSVKEAHVYMVTAPILDRNNKEINAVSLTSGCLVSFDPNKRVIPRENAEVVY